MPPRNRRYRKTSRMSGPNTSSWSDKERAALEESEKKQTPIAELDLSVRVINTLEGNNVILVEHLLAQDYESLMKMKNLGDKTLLEIRAALVALGVTPPEWKKPPKPKKFPKARKIGKANFELW